MNESDDEEQQLRSVTLQNAKTIFLARQRAEEALVRAKELLEQKTQKLARSEEQFRQLADALPQIVWTARPDGFIDYYNQRWYEFTGFARDEYGDQSWKPILHPDDVQRCLDTYYGCIRSGNLYQIEYRFKDRNTGGYRWFLGRAYPVLDEQGTVVRWFGTCTDIDDTKHVEETTRFLADASAALAGLTDYRSTLQKVASLAVPAFADWCSVDVEEADGSISRLAATYADADQVRVIDELLHRNHPQRADAAGIMKVFRTGESQRVKITDACMVETALDAEHLRMIRKLELKSYICTPVRSRGKNLGVLTFLTAESGRIYDAQDLVVAEDLAHRAAIAIENANLLTALKDSDKRKDEFLAMLAHELRNPLGPIRNAVQIFRSKGPLGPELKRAAELIDHQVHQMTRLVDDLLDVSRITKGKIELQKERVEVAELVKNAIEASHALIAECGHELTVSLPAQLIHVEVDPTRLEQVLLNLLNNAAKYMERGGRMSVAVERQDEHAVIRVADTGIGIPREMLSTIFDMFTQLDRSLERSHGGLGLGLTLVKNVVEMHGGTVAVHSDGVGQGSEFTVRLPIVVGEPKSAPSKTLISEPSITAARRILVVDDNWDSAESLALVLELFGHEAHTAADGIEAVEAAETFRPDVILLDIGLPKLNGYEAARRIREEPWGKSMVLIALTGWGQEEDRQKSRDAGFNTHMVKPVDHAELKKLLNAIPSK